MKAKQVYVNINKTKTNLSFFYQGPLSSAVCQACTANQKLKIKIIDTSLVFRFLTQWSFRNRTHESKVEMSRRLCDTQFTVYKRWGCVDLTFYMWLSDPLPLPLPVRGCSSRDGWGAGFGGQWRWKCEFSRPAGSVSFSQQEPFNHGSSLQQSCSRCSGLHLNK